MSRPSRDSVDVAKYPRTREPWTKEEVDLLLLRVREGKSLTEISLELERSELILAERLKVVCLETFLTGGTEQDAIDVTKLDEKTVARLYLNSRRVNDARSRGRPVSY